MNPEYALVKKQIHRSFSIPSQVLSYMGLCYDFKQKNNDTEGKSTIPNCLPLVSEITMKSTPQGMLHAYLSFLKYSH